MSFPFDTPHTRISLQDPEAKYSPLGENATLQTGKKWSVKVLY